MEWLGILLLYLISGFMKKRQKDAKRRDIESDPNWDLPLEADDPSQQEKPKQNLDQWFENLFETIEKFDPEKELGFKPKTSETIEPIIVEEPEPVEQTITYSDDDLTNIDEQSTSFEDNIYHSNLADREEMHLGKKWRKKSQLRSELFESKQSLKKAIILKEVLDKPVGLR